jgi:biopolymer transport protein ExbD
MVASTYIVSQAIKVELPKAKTSDGASQGPATLTLIEDGTVRWTGALIPEAEVRGAIEAAVKSDPALELVISADRAVTHGRVVTFIDRAKLAGVVRFAINVEQN